MWHIKYIPHRYTGLIDTIAIAIVWPCKMSYAVCCCCVRTCIWQIEWNLGFRSPHTHSSASTSSSTSTLLKNIQNINYGAFNLLEDTTHKFGRLFKLNWISEMFSSQFCSQTLPLPTHSLARCLSAVDPKICACLQATYFEMVRNKISCIYQIFADHQHIQIKRLNQQF